MFHQLRQISDGTHTFLDYLAEAADPSYSHLAIKGLMTLMNPRSHNEILSVIIIAKKEAERNAYGGCSPPKYIDPILKLQAQDALKDNREKLARQLNKKLSIEEFKLKYNSNTKSQMRMENYAKKLQSLYAFERRILTIPIGCNVLPLPRRKKRMNEQIHQFGLVC